MFKISLAIIPVISLVLIAPAHAQGLGGGGDIISSFIVPMALIFGVFWFLLIRPQMRRQREHRAMTEALKPGMRVLTAGGIMGRISKAVEGAHTIEVEISPGVKVEVVRSTITEAQDKDGNPVTAPGAKAKPAMGSGKDKGGKK